MSSATAHPVDDHAHRAALAAPTLHAAAPAAETVTSTDALIAVRDLPLVVHRVREATSLTEAQAEELRRAQLKARTT